MNAVIAKIDEAQRALDAADNRITSALELIEQSVRGIVSTRIETAVEGEKFSRVAFGKHRGAWGFLVEFPGGDPQTLLSCSRDVRARVLAGGHLERLLLEAADLIRNQLDGRKAAGEAANNLLQILNHQGA